jgi:hypothetical protein
MKNRKEQIQVPNQRKCKNIAMGAAMAGQGQSVAMSAAMALPRSCFL